VFVNVDMEQYAFKDATIRIFRNVMADDEFRDWADVGIAIQAYLRDTGDDLRALADWAKQPQPSGLGAAGEGGVLGLRIGYRGAE